MRTRGNGNLGGHGTSATPRRWVVVFAAMFLFAAPLTATGYRYDYDYPEQGDDWYGRSGGTDATRDYPAFEMDRFSAGDDYGYGYDPSVDILGPGPPLELTRRRHTEYHFRFFTLIGCLETLDCADGSFCNGEEVCSSTGCGPGIAACEDFEPCTVDTCAEATDECSNLWVPPPDEITGLVIDRQTPGSATATLGWDALPDAEWYEVYRGEQTDLGDLTCFADPVTGTSVDDDGAVATGGLYCYLTSAVACDRESTLGEASSGSPRPDPPHCP